MNSKLLEGNTQFLFKFKNEIKKQRLKGVISDKAKKALKYYRRKTHRSGFELKKTRKQLGSIYVWPCGRYQISVCSDYNAKHIKLILLKGESKRGQICTPFCLNGISKHTLKAPTQFQFRGTSSVLYSNLYQRKDKTRVTL